LLQILAVEQKRKELREARAKAAEEASKKKTGLSRFFGIKSDEEKQQQKDMKKQEEELSFKNLNEEDLKQVYLTRSFWISFVVVS
jgi:hypothetical protein